MPPNFRATWIGLVLLALAAWLLTGTSGTSPLAEAEPTLKSPRLSAQFVALRHDDDDHDHDEDEDEDWDEEEEDDEDYDEEEEEYEDWDDEDLEEMIERLEVERAHLEVRRAELQATFGELELIQEVTAIAEDPSKTAAFAIVAAADAMEHEKVAPFLEEVLQKSSDPVVRRLARIQLAEAYAEMDQPSKAFEQVRTLVLGE